MNTQSSWGISEVLFSLLNRTQRGGVTTFMSTSKEVVEKFQSLLVHMAQPLRTRSSDGLNSGAQILKVFPKQKACKKDRTSVLL